MRRFPIRALLTFRAIDTLKKKGAAGIAPPPWYACCMKKNLTISEFARMGGKARAAKLSKEQLSAIDQCGSESDLLSHSLATVAAGILLLGVG
jgi:hypothetical protein